uniref:Uncharacterized protein n=1 Tax=Sinocyclocheilus rhinocerous TaxID=307959 RepID=A0A673HN29_9TELE
MTNYSLSCALLKAVLNAVIPDHVADAFSPPRSETPLLLDPGSWSVLFFGKYIDSARTY